MQVFTNTCIHISKPTAVGMYNIQRNSMLWYFPHLNGNVGIQKRKVPKNAMPEQDGEDCSIPCTEGTRAPDNAVSEKAQWLKHCSDPRSHRTISSGQG